MDRERFERIVRNKAIIGIPFTLEDVLETGKCQHMALPVCDCARPKPNGFTSWLLALEKQGVMRKIDTRPVGHGRTVAVYGGFHYEYGDVEEVA